jgi:YgiT-type zinc finger domain-containing protein
MFRCHVCGATEAKKETINEIFQIDDRPVLVQNIPATVCARCGEESFSRETTERVRQMVHGKAKPVRSISMDVFAFESQSYV